MNFARERVKFVAAIALCLAPAIVLTALNVLESRAGIAAVRHQLAALPRIAPVLALIEPLSGHDVAGSLARVHAVEDNGLARDEAFGTGAQAQALTAALRLAEPDQAASIAAARNLIERLGETSGLEGDADPALSAQIRVVTRHIPAAEAATVPAVAALQEARKSFPLKPDRRTVLRRELERWTASRDQVLHALEGQKAAETFRADESRAPERVSEILAAAAVSADDLSRALLLHRDYVVALTRLSTTILNAVGSDLSQRIDDIERRSSLILAGAIMSMGLGLALAAGLFFSAFREPQAKPVY